MRGWVSGHLNGLFAGLMVSNVNISLLVETTTKPPMQHLPDQTQLWEMFVSISVLLVLFLSTVTAMTVSNCIQTSLMQ